MPVIDLNKHIVSEQDLKPYIQEGGLKGKAIALLKQQQESWDMARRNFESLNQLEIKHLLLGNSYSFYVQHNPGRIRSAEAKVDAKTLAERPCFLCALPEEQKGFLLEENYLLLINPFPIFKEHFTIPAVEHIPQRIAGRTLDFFKITQSFDGLTVLYNGAKCGASAPDHFHFQVFGQFDLPVFTYKTEQINTEVSLGTFPFPFFKVVGRDIDKMNRLLMAWMEKLAAVSTEEEPRLNLLCRFMNKQWELIIIPRTNHRASSYFKSGEEQLLVSPGAVDFSLIIASRKQDFLKLGEKQVREIMSEVTWNSQDLKKMIH